MTKNAYTIEDFEEIQKQQQYKHIGLFDSDGEKILAYNSNSVTPALRIKEIKTRLKSPGLPDGVYLIKCKGTLSKGGRADVYPIVKGDIEDQEFIIQSNGTKATPNLAENSVISYQGALQMQVENATLKIENEALKKEVKELKEELSNIEWIDEDEEKEQTLGERAKSWFEDMIPIIDPLITQHYKLQDKKIHLAMIREYRKQGQPMPNQKKRPVDDQSTDDQTKYDTTGVQIMGERIMNYVNEHQDEPEKFNKMAALYNDCQSPDDFFVKFQEAFDDETYQDLMQYVQDDQEEQEEEEGDDNG